MEIIKKQSSNLMKLHRLIKYRSNLIKIEPIIIDISLDVHINTIQNNNFVFFITRMTGKTPLGLFLNHLGTF